MKKPFYKRVWFWVLAVIVVIAVANSGEDTEKKDAATTNTTTDTTATDKNTATSNTDTTTEKPDVEEKKEPKNDPGISKAEFDKIKNGMTYKEVVEIIGGEGEVMSEVGEVGTEFHTIMYTFDGESGFGANANFTFQGGKLMSKAQFGLK